MCWRWQRQLLKRGMNQITQMTENVRYQFYSVCDLLCDDIICTVFAWLPLQSPGLGRVLIFVVSWFRSCHAFRFRHETTLWKLVVRLLMSSVYPRFSQNLILVHCKCFNWHFNLKILLERSQVPDSGILQWIIKQMVCNIFT